MKLKPVKHIVLLAFSFILSGMLFLPTLLGLAHAFSDHEHTQCYEFDATHFHKKDIECEIYKFKSNQYVYHVHGFTEPSNLQTPSQQVFNYYFFLSEFQSLHFLLRGPPSIV
ncbi:hypothetical protein MQE36_13635 [Zhouia spongiae]|uniref:Uncharacterized protein n=1 Tax=Zhouia spongiae TaxID=2202721 RepID=A0ABY3YJW9_9FLAO|nr:hypothetical protein [Zhouia spongiae]UNY98122.1 hypothetical protein MQE36_13635 [Zhouia spongiae]